MVYRVRPFYNLDGPVGKGVRGQPDDILLVKYFLTELTKADQTWATAAPDTPLAVDSLPSDALNEWITAYQQMKKNFHSSPVVVDGRVDPVPGYWSSTTPNQHAMFILSWMNSDFSVSFTDRFNDLAHDENAPAALREVLRNKPSI
jgi:hypothetical protein